MNKLGFYLHTPFCQHKCGYCDFNSWAETSPLLQKKWLEGVKKEVLFWRQQWDFPYKVDTFFFGGGTPSLLEDEILIDLKNFLFENLNFDESLEWSVECNPETITPEKLALLNQLGVNRISIGIQSFQDVYLQRLERKANRQRNLLALECVEQNWPHQWSLDLMYALPDQNIEEWRSDLLEALNYSMKHISAYQLTLSTPKAKKWKQDEEDELLEFAQLTKKLLQEAGFNQYEVSNYSKSGFECRHNLKYWTLEPFLGVGPGAYTLLLNNFSKEFSNEAYGFHYKSPSHFDRWLENADQLEYVKNNLELRNDKTHLSEFIIQNMRLAQGFSLKSWPFKGIKIQNAVGDMPELLELNGDFLRSTQRGFELLDYTSTQLLRWVDRVALKTP